MPSAAAGNDARENAGDESCPLTATHLAAIAGLAADTGRPPADAVADLLRLAAEITGMDTALLGRVDPNGGCETVLAVADDGGIVPASQAPAAESFGAAAVARGGLLALPDVAADPFWRHHPARRHMPAVRAYYAAPVMRPDGRPYGALACVAREPRSLDPARRDALSVLAALAVPLALRLELAHGDAEQPRSHDSLGRLPPVDAAAPDLLAEIDRMGRIRYANPAFAALLGMDANDAALFDRLHPDDVPAWTTAFAALGAGSSSVRLEGRLRRADGSWRRLEATASKRAYAGDVIVLAARDLTDRAAVGAALATERDRLRAILDAIPDPVFLKDAGGRVLVANAAAAAVWNLPAPEAAVGATAGDLLPAEIAAAASAEDAEVYATGHAVAGRLHALDRADGRHWYLHDKSPVFAADGALVGLVGVWCDVTALAEARAALEDERWLLQAVLDTLPQAITLKDPAGRYLRINATAARATGLGSPAEAIGRTAADFVPPAVAAAVAAEEADALAGGGTTTRQIEPADGASPARWYELSKTPIRGRDGAIVGLVGSATDVTDRVRAEQELRRERDLLRTVMDAIPDVLIVKDAEGRYLRMNRAAADLMGLADPAAAIGRLPDAVWPAAMAADVAREDAQVLAGASLSNVLAPAADWGDRWLLTNRLPLRDADGRIVGLVVSSRDVTELHRAQEEAAAREGVLTRYKMLVDHTSDIILDVDRAGTIRSVNPAITRLLGIRPEDIVGRSGFDWIAPDDRPAVREIFARIVATPGVSPPFVIRGLRGDGGIAWLEETANNQLHNPAVGSIVFVIRDISAQHEAEVRLRAERDLLQAVIDASSEIITVQDATGRYTSMNATAARAFRLPDVAAGIGKRPADVLSPEEAEQQARVARRIFQTGQATTDEIVFADASGAPAWYLVNRHPLRDATGAVTGMVGVARDVTPLKLAEQAATAERDLLQAFIDVVPDMLFLKDVDGRFLRINAAYAAWLGLPGPEAAVGMRPGDFVPPEEAAQLAEQDRRIIATGETLRDHVTRSEESGGTRWFLRTKLPHRDSNGRVVGVVGAYRDVTGIMLAEQELERERDLLQQILDALRDRVLVKDRQGRYVRINRAAATSLGLSDPAEAVGRPANTLLPASVVESGLAGDAAALAGEVVEDVREERWADGSSHWMLVGKTPLRGADGDVVGLVVAATDVSVVKEAEQRMAEALAREQATTAELERLAHARSAFIAMLSHEFRTPLTAIMGYGELLREYDLDPATTREYADEIARSADRLSRLTGDVLDLERMRSDRFQIERASVDLAALLREVVTSLLPSAPAHDLRLDLAADLPPVAGDPDRLIQVFTNLVSNAVKYSPEGGEVVVAARADDGGVLAAVSDQGLGIPPEDLERVFEPYVRLGAGGERTIRGTGLGLPIARQLVELHGGTIWAESGPGAGSTFFVRLPVDEAGGGRR